MEKKDTLPRLAWLLQPWKKQAKEMMKAKISIHTAS